MKSKFTSALLLSMSVAFLALESCQKTEIPTNANPGKVNTASVNAISKGSVGQNFLGKNSTGGGGTSTGGHNGGSSGGGTVTTTDPSLAPADTTTSQLPVGDIITAGRWKLTSFVQGNDNTTSQFANYIFTFNSDGSMIADDNGNQTIGYWHYQEAIFYYGIPVYGSSPYGFTMTIGSGLPLTSLNENYFISKKTLTTIYIDSINPNENAHITFSKLAQ